MPILTPCQHETETINPANFLDNGAFPYLLQATG